MLAGATRIVEIAFFTSSKPSTASSDPEPEPLLEDDNNSDHTLAMPSPGFVSPPRSSAQQTQTKGAVAGQAFRHLPPFVSRVARVKPFLCVVSDD